MASIRKGGIITLVLGTCLLVASCGSTRRNSSDCAFGGNWGEKNMASTATLQKQEPLPTSRTLPIEPGDTAKASKPGNLGQIRRDIRFITSKQSIDKLKSEVHESLNAAVPEDEIGTRKTAVDYFSNFNVLAGSLLTLLGLVLVGIFPIFGFVVLMVGLLMGMVGLYDVKHPGNYTE